MGRFYYWLVSVPLIAAGCGADCPSGTVRIEGSCKRGENTRVKTPADSTETSERGDAVAQSCSVGPGEAVCDDQGTLHVCGDDGKTETTHVCGSRDACNLGLEDKKCPSCEPGKDHECQGRKLMVCDRKGQSFVQQSECSSAEACDKEQGACKQDACKSGSFRCDKDILLECKSGQAWSFSAQCDPGRCSADRKACAHCAPGEKMCDGDNLLTCDQAGENLERTSCSGDTPHCAEGACVRCVPGSAACMQAQPMSANSKDRMKRGEQLSPGESLQKGTYRLAYQADGDLVLYRESTRIWGSLDFALSPQTPPGQFAMEADGNVVIRNADGKMIWRTGTSCFGQYLSLLSDGNVCVYDASDSVVWCSGAIGR